MQGFRPAWVYPSNMKTTRFIRLLLAAVLAAGCTHIEMPKESTSPKDGDNKVSFDQKSAEREVETIVTVKQADGQVYFQVDSVTYVYPFEGYYDSYKGPKRVACGLTLYRSENGWYQTDQG